MLPTQPPTSSPSPSHPRHHVSPSPCSPKHKQQQHRHNSNSIISAATTFPRTSSAPPPPPPPPRSTQHWNVANAVTAPGFEHITPSLRRLAEHHPLPNGLCSVPGSRNVQNCQGVVQFAPPDRFWPPNSAQAGFIGIGPASVPVQILGLSVICVFLPPGICTHR